MATKQIPNPLKPGEFTEGERVNFETVKEAWNEYRCEDGTIIRFKAAVTSVYRTSLLNNAGDIIYVANSSNLMDVEIPQHHQKGIPGPVKRVQ